MADQFDDFDVGDNTTLIASLLSEIQTDGYDCASVDVLVRMARDGEFDSVGDILGALVVAGHADWAGEILRMTMASTHAGTDPDYAISAAILTYLIDMGHGDWAHSVCPHLLVYQKQGPDCYDFAFTLGHMVRSRKAKQASQILQRIYDDETASDFKSLVPCLLGTLIDWEQIGWATELLQQLCVTNGVDAGPEYSTAGWCLAQHVYFGRPDWAAIICSSLRQHPPVWYSEAGIMQSVGSWGGEGYIHEIVKCMAHGPPAAAHGAPHSGRGY